MSWSHIVGQFGGKVKVYSDVLVFCFRKLQIVQNGMAGNIIIVPYQPGTLQPQLLFNRDTKLVSFGRFNESHKAAKYLFGVRGAFSFHNLRGG